MVNKEKLERLNEEYKTFQKAGLWWLEKLGLHGWKVDFKQCNPSEAGVDTIAEVTYCLSDMKATIRYYGEYDTKGHPEQSALHEVLHLLLAVYDDGSLKSVGEREHAIINRLIPFLAPIYMDNINKRGQ